MALPTLKEANEAREFMKNKVINKRKKLRHRMEENMRYEETKYELDIYTIAYDIMKAYIYKLKDETR